MWELLRLHKQNKKQSPPLAVFLSSPLRLTYANYYANPKKIGEKAGSREYSGQITLLRAAKVMSAAPVQGCRKERELSSTGSTHV